LRVRIPLAPPPIRQTSVLRGHWSGRFSRLCRSFGADLWSSRRAPRVLLFSDRPVFSEALYDCDLVQSSAGPNLGHPLQAELESHSRTGFYDQSVSSPFRAIESSSRQARPISVATVEAGQAQHARRHIAMPGIWPIVRKYRDAPPAPATHRAQSGAVELVSRVVRPS
jgi:hypothetical protein